MHLKVLEELYRMDNLDLERLRKKLKIDDRVIQRAIRKILEIILQSRSIFEPGPRETVAREIADIGYLLEKGMSSLALDQIEKSLHACRQKELFEEHRQLLSIRRRLTGEMHDSDSEAAEVEVKQRNLIAFLSLRARSKADLQDNRGGKSALRLRSILSDELIMDPSEAMSVKAEFQRLSIRWRIFNYLREYEQMIVDLERLLQLLQEHSAIIDANHAELMEHRFILAQVYIHRSQVDRARALMNSIQNMELYAADLIAKRFEKYCLTQLGIACDVGDEAAGNSALSLLDKHFNRYMNSISPLMQRLMLYMAAKFQFYRGDYSAADQYIRRIMSLSSVEQFSDFVPFAKTIQLLAAFEQGDVDNLDNKLRGLHRTIATYDPEHQLPAMTYHAVKLASKGLEAEVGGIFQNFQNRLPEIAVDEFDYLDMRVYLEARRRGISMLDLASEQLAHRGDLSDAV